MNAKLHVGVAAMLVLCSTVWGQVAEIPCGSALDGTSSGLVDNTAGSGPIEWTHTVTVPPAVGLRLQLVDVTMASPYDTVSVRSTRDGEVQTLTRSQLLDWNDGTGWFNGASVDVTLRVVPGSAASITIASVAFFYPTTPVGTDDLCNGSDDRVPTTDNRAFRLVSFSGLNVGICTGWLVSGDSLFFTAGHCHPEDPAPQSIVAEFDVPYSVVWGAPVAPPIWKQFPVIRSSVTTVDNGPGNDWSMGRLGNNSFNQPVSAVYPQVFYFADDHPTAPAVLVATGFGIDDTPNLTYNSIEQTASGPFLFRLGDQIAFDVDVDHGNSGGPLYDAATGAAYGIVTHKACLGSSNQNTATSIFKPAVQAAYLVKTSCQSLAASAPGSLPLLCSPVAFTPTLAPGHWNVIGVSATSDWGLRAGTAPGLTSNSSGDACEFLIQDGAQGLPAASTVQAYGAGSARIQHAVAVPLSIGVPVTTTWANTDVVQAFEVVSNGGLHDVTVAGDPTLTWFLYSAVGDSSWRTRTLATPAASATAGGNPVSFVSLSPGRCVLVVSRNGGAAGLANAALTVRVCNHVDELILTPGIPAAVTNGCQPFATYAFQNQTVPNVVSLASQGPWSLSIGTTTVTNAGPGCNVAVLNAPQGVTTDSGLFSANGGAPLAVADYALATPMASNAQVSSAIDAGHLHRALYLVPPTPGSYLVATAGDPSLRWAFFGPGAPGVWQSPAMAQAGGSVGHVSLPMNLATAVYTLVVWNDSGSASSQSMPFAVSVCGAAPTLPLTAATTTPVNTSLLCQPFTVTPWNGAWNVVGVSGPPDWNMQIGNVPSVLGGNACDFLVANGHGGPITATSGVLARVPTGSTATTAEHVYALFPSAPGTQSSLMPLGSFVRLHQFDVPSTGTYVVGMTGGASGWALFAPASGSGWRARSQANAGGAPSFVTMVLTPGPHAIVVFRDGGPATSVTPYSVTLDVSPNVPPTLTSSVPSTFEFDGQAVATSVTLLGANFVPGATVRVDGVVLPATFVSPGRLDVVLPASVLSSAGTRTIQATNPAPGGGNSATLAFVVTNAAPVLTASTPSAHVLGTGPLTLAVSGSAFIAGQSQIVVDGTPIPTTWNSTTGLAAVVPPSLSWPPRDALVTVQTPGPGGGTSAARTLTIIGQHITSLVPATVPPQPVGAPAVTVQVMGSGFVPSSVVLGNGLPLSTTYVTSGRLDATLPAGMTVLREIGGITVHVSTGSDSESNAVALRVGTGTNQGTIRLAPPSPAPGTSFSLFLEGGLPNAPITYVLDLGNPDPVGAFPESVTNLVLGVGSPGMLVLFDGSGVLAPPVPAAFAPDPNGTAPGGTFVLPGITMPSPALGVTLSAQALYPDPAAPLGFRLTWARRNLSF